MTKFDLSSWMSSLKARVAEQAAKDGLNDPNTPPPLRACGDCDVQKAAQWKSDPGMWMYPACDEILACRLRRREEANLRAYEAAVQRARVPVPMRQFSLKERPGRTLLTVDKKNRSLADACYNWDGKRWLIASGSVGSGKTTWLTALLMEHLMDDPSVNARWTSEQRMYRKASLHADLRHAGRDHVIQEFMDAQVLVLDDLGASRRDLTEWQGGAMRDLLIERHLLGAPTLISTNLSLEQIARKYGDHVASRLGEMSGGIITVNGFDRRSKKKKAT
jgi:DNA replication protein DnaC